MKVTRIGSFTEEEKTDLQKAGQILGSIAKSLESAEVDTLSEEDLALTVALDNVLSRIMDALGPQPMEGEN